MVRRSGFGEAPQAGFAASDPVAFTRFMFALYDYRCAVTGRQFSAVAELPHPDLDVFLFQPQAHDGRLSPSNAIVVDIGAAGLLAKGVMLISDTLEAYIAGPEAVGAVPGPMPLHLPEDPALWPDRDLLAYHRSLFRTQ